MAHAGGRPTKYRPHYCQDLIDYFTVPRPDPGNPQGMVYFPTMYGFAGRIGISDDTIADWCKKYPEFLRAYTIAQQLGRNQLIHGGLSEKYNASFAKFVGVNMGLISEHSKNESVNTNINTYPQGITVNFVQSDKTGG